MQLLIGDLLADAAAAKPAGTAATLGGRSATFSDLHLGANRIANALHGMGVRRSNIVLWWSSPSISSMAGFAATARLGAVFVSLNPSLSNDELAGILEYLEPRIVVTGEGVQPEDRSFSGIPSVAVERLLESGSASAPDAGSGLDDSSPHVIYLTSGTTGAPKGVEVSHRASWLRSFPGGSTFATGLRGDGGILASFPLFHYGGWHFVLEAWHHRCAFHVCERFGGDVLLETAARRRPSAMYCIPA
ncbi:MAG TPA: class I adenylate-forming enzyme family protein, partial [Acidimicrobiales bacterium]|nr:class I adenylate-forming enzyme family protein [Acidimicrobiales bacterium]